MRFWLEIEFWRLEIGASYGLCPFDYDYFDIALIFDLDGIHLISSNIDDED